MLFLSNFLCLVLAGTFIFAAPGYRDAAPVARTRSRAPLALGGLGLLVVIPLGLSKAAN